MGGEIRRGPTASAVPHTVVQPMMIDPSRQSAQAAIQAVNADSEKANMQNNMHGGWVPNPPKTKVVKSKKVKGGRGRRRSYRTQRRYSRSNVYDARVSRRLRMRMLQRRIKKRKSRRHGSLQRQLQLQMRGGSGGGQVPLQPAVQTVPQHGSSCTAGDTNCAGNISKGILDLNAQAVANSHGDKVSPLKV